MNVIETRKLTRRFGKGGGVIEADFELPAGGVCALLGPNGAGKSTLLRLLMGIERPDSGEARVLGRDCRRLGPAEYSRIGYMAEAQTPPAWMTVRELLDFCRPLYPTWDRDLESRLVRQFELPTGQTIGTFSRGMVAKVSLVAALAHRPELVLLDEPFSSLDVVVRGELVAGLLEAVGLGEWTILVSSHDFSEVEQLVDRVALVDKGHLWASESMDSLQGRFRRVEVMLPQAVSAISESGSGGQSGLASVPPPLPTGAGAPLKLPEGWLEYEQAGSFVRFIDSKHGSEASALGCAERFAGATVTQHPMSLREIFVAITKARRAGQMEAVA